MAKEHYTPEGLVSSSNLAIKQLEELAVFEGLSREKNAQFFARIDLLRLYVSVFSEFLQDHDEISVKKDK